MYWAAFCNGRSQNRLGSHFATVQLADIKGLCSQPADVDHVEASEGDANDFDPIRDISPLTTIQTHNPDESRSSFFFWLNLICNFVIALSVILAVRCGLWCFSFSFSVISLFFMNIW